MKNLKYLASFCLIVFFSILPLRAVEVCLDVDFAQGIPTDFTLINVDGSEPDTEYFDEYVVTPRATWFAAKCMSNSKAAISISRRLDSEIATDNWMITNKFTVPSADVYVRWRAYSVLQTLPESYEVVAFTQDDRSDAQVLASIDAETYDWTTHLHSLTEYAGKEIYLAFRHTSTNRYMLVVDDLYVGELSEPLLEATNTSRHFFSDDEDAGIATLTGTLRNYGSAITISEMRLVLANGEDSYTMECNCKLEANDELSFEFSLPIAQNDKAYDYTVYAVNAADASQIEVCGDYFVGSDYKRIMLIEEFTGIWCNTCTWAMPYVHDMQKLYGDEIALVNVHVYGGSEVADPMYNPIYHTYMKVYNVPSMFFDRDRDSNIGDHTGCKNYNSYIRKHAERAVRAKIESTAEWTAEDNIKITSTVQFADDIDNSDKRYRVGYIIRERYVQDDNYYQRNNASLPTMREYSFLPSYVPGDVMLYDYVARGGEDETTFDALGMRSGIVGNVPQTIVGKTDYSVESTVVPPLTIRNRDNIEIVAVLFHNEDVVNCCQINDISGSSGVETVIGSEEIFVSHSGNALTLIFPADAPYSATVYSVDGKTVAQCTSIGSAHTFCNLLPGCYIVTATQSSAHYTSRVVLK